MADPFSTVTPPDLPALTQVDGSELVAVWRNGRLARMPQRDLRGTKTFSGAGGPPYEASRLFTMQASLNDRWRDTTTRDEYKLTVLNPITWVFDGNVGGGRGEKGDPGAGISPKGQFATTADLPSMGLSGDLYVATADDTADPPAFLAGDGAMYVATGGTFGPGNKYRNIGPFRGPPGATTVDGLEDATLGFKALNVEDPSAPGNPVGDALAAKATAQQPAAGFSNAETLTDFRKRVVAERINVTDPKWAGGAKVDGVTDDSAAMNAISAYIRARTNKYLSSFIVYAPPGIMQMGATWDISGCHGLNFDTAGRDAFAMRASGNFPVIRQIATTINDSIVGLSLGPLSIIGGGYLNSEAHGIVIQAASDGSIDAKFYSCRDCLRISTSFQLVLKWIRVSGAGGLQNWNGLVMTDGITGVAENAVIDLGGCYDTCANTGVRITNCTGSKFISTESTGCTNYGWYIGDSPSGKECKWFLMVQCLADTTANGLVLSRGGCTGVWGNFTIIGMWIGNTQGNGSAALLAQGVTSDANIEVGISIDCDYAAIFRNCAHMDVTWKSLSGYDRFNKGTVAILVEATSDSAFHLGRIRPHPAATNPGNCFTETSGSSRNTYTGFNAERPFALLNPGGVNNSGVAGRAAGALYGLVHPS